MKSVNTLLLLLLLFSCKENKKNVLGKQSTKIEYAILNQHDTIVENIAKNCEESYDMNIYSFYLCKEWNLLNENQIKNILRSATLGDGGEGDSRLFHYAVSKSSIWTKADVIIGKEKYKIEINGGSYFYLIGNTSSLYFCESNKFRTYFITGIGEDNDELYNEKIIKVEKEIKSLKTDLSYWNGNYDFDNGNYEQGYRNYHIKIENSICILYQGQLPAHEIECITVEKNEQLYLYLKSDDLSDAKYDVTLIKSLERGDFLLKLFKVKDTYFVNSKLINYWSDDKQKFEENMNIEVIKN